MALTAPQTPAEELLERQRAYEAAVAAEDVAQEAYAVARRAAERAFSDAAVDPDKRDAADGAETELTIRNKQLSEAQLATAKTLVAFRGGRVDDRDGLPTGEFAELQTRPTHDEWKRLVKTTIKLAAADFDEKVDLMTEYVAVLLSSWNVRDRDGHELPADRDGVSKAPQSTLIPVFERAAAIFRSIPHPNL